MSEFIDIEKVIRNTRRYWFADGIVELCGGGLISFFALSYYLTSLISNVVVKSLLLGLGQPVIILLGAFAIRKIITWMKENITYPRTGYLSFHNPPENRRVQRIIKVIIVSAIASMVVAFFTQLLSIQLMPVISMVLFSLVTIYLGYQNAVTRFYFVAVVLITLGLILSAVNMEDVMRFVILYASLGFTWMVSGLITLFNYLRKTSPAREDE
jgi:hypothetical protein